MAICRLMLRISWRGSQSGRSTGTGSAKVFCSPIKTPAPTARGSTSASSVGRRMVVISAPISPAIAEARAVSGLNLGGRFSDSAASGTIFTSSSRREMGRSKPWTGSIVNSLNPGRNRIARR